MDLVNNPHYQNGVYNGNNVIKNIENTTYGSIEVALKRKKELVEDFKKQFGWDETHKDVAETLGIIAALETEQKRLDSIVEPGPTLSIEDVYSVANSIGLSIDEDIANKALEMYPDAQENDPSATWDLVIEQIIHELKN